MDNRIPAPAKNSLGGEKFTITERRATKRQDGTWYFETVKVEKTGLL
jgi:hypothetical protein